MLSASSWSSPKLSAAPQRNMLSVRLVPSKSAVLCIAKASLTPACANSSGAVPTCRFYYFYGIPAHVRSPLSRMKHHELALVACRRHLLTHLRRIGLPSEAAEVLPPDGLHAPHRVLAQVETESKA